MKASVYRRYGGPEVVSVQEIARPKIGANEVLVAVEATSVTTADWRMRASAFPGGLWLAGRLMTGLFKPKNTVLGVEFAGRVAEVGAKVTEFAVGDAVFGFSGSGAHAEYVKVAADGAITKRPEGLGAGEAAALPFGGLSALVFLRDVAQVTPGQRVLVVGASGGVGVYAVQIARALGAEVTGVASADNLDLVRELGAVEAVDYRAEDISQSDRRFDVIFDTVGALGYRDAARILAEGGIFVPLNFGIREVLQLLGRKLFGGPRMAISVSGDTREDLDALTGMVKRGELRPVIDRRYPLARIAEAHAYVEARHRKGAVVIDIAPGAVLSEVACGLKRTITNTGEIPFDRPG